MMSSGGLVALNLNSGTEKVEHDVQFYYMFSSNFGTLGVAFSGLALFRRL